jgi:NADPH-dependent F420 reductase
MNGRIRSPPPGSGATIRSNAATSCDDARMPSPNDAQLPSFPTTPGAAAQEFGTVAVLGGTGPQGRGLARRFAAAGVPVVLGSRDAGRASQAAQPMTDAGLPIHGAANAAAAAAGQIVIVAVPYEGHEQLLKSLSTELTGKIVVDCVNPLGFDKQGCYQLIVPEGSAAQQAAALLPDSRVVAAFHHVSAVLLEDESLESVDTDVLVLGDDREATDIVGRLADVVPGMRGIYAGRLRNAGQVEALTANLVSINRRYKAHAGLRVTDV